MFMIDSSTLFYSTEEAVIQYAVMENWLTIRNAVMLLVCIDSREALKC